MKNPALGAWIRRFDSWLSVRYRSAKGREARMGEAGDATLEGRILALELLMHGFMMEVVMQRSPLPPLEFLAGWEGQMKASLQHIERPLTDRADEVWGAAADALTLAFATVRGRVAASYLPDKKD